jgi:MFS family permease
MRRGTGFVLTLLGAFLIVVAALLRFWLAPNTAKFPLNEYQVITLSGSGSYFSQAQVAELTGVNVRVTFTVRGNVGLGNGTNAVWDFFKSVRDTTNQAPITYVPYREAFNRKTGQLVNCCGEYVTDPVTEKANHSVHMSGLGLFFPLGAQKQNYTVFDPTAARTELARYEGTANVDGILTYKYVEKASPAKFGTDDVPGSLTGNASATTVPLGEYYSATNTYYIDPETGAPLDTAQDQTITLGNSPSNVQILGSDISVVETGPSIASSVSADQSARRDLALIQVILPLIGLLLGLVLLVAGIILVRSGRDEDGPDPAWMGNRQLNTYPDTGPRVFFLAVTVLATITLYYELYVGGSVSTLVLNNLHMDFTFYVVVLAFGNLIGAFGSLFAGLADRIGRANIVVIGLFFTGVFTAFVLPAATNKWSLSIEGFVVGVVEGMALVATPALIRDFSPQVGRAAAMGFWTAGPVAGSLIVTAVATNTIPAVINDQRFWTHEYHICGAVGLIVWVIAFFGLRELSPQLRDQLMVTMRDRLLIEARARGLNVEQLLHRPFRQLLKPDVVISALAVALMLLIYYTAVAFGLIYLTSVFGFSVKDANGLGNWNWGFEVIAVILVGILSDLVRVRKPFMLIGGIGAAVMTVVYLEQAGHHPGYYTVALMLAGLAFFLGLAYTPWMASFTETVEHRNPALVATGLAIWGWILRVVVFVSFLIIPHLITSVTPIVNYGTTATQYEATYPKQIAFAQAHPAIVTEAQKYQKQLALAQELAPELAVLQAHNALFTQLAAYPNPADAPANLINEAIAAAGGGAKGLAMLTDIGNNQAGIESVRAVQTQLLQLKPYSAQLTALQKVPSYVFPYLEAHGTVLKQAQAQAPRQWQHWYWVCFFGIVFFLLCIPVLRGRWSPAAARRDEEEHEAATRAELSHLADAGSDLAGAES